MSIILNLVSHKFDIQENGRISLSVEYIGALEESINGNSSDILALMDRLKKASPSVETTEDDVEVKRQRIADMEEYIECLKLNETGDDEVDAYKDNIENLEEEIKDATENIDEMTSEMKGLVYQQFLTHLNQKVYNIDVEESEIKEWIESINEDKDRPSFDGLAERIVSQVPDNAEEAADAAEEAASEESGDTSEVGDVIEKAKAEKEDPSKGYINFLFFGDIMEAACEVMNPQMNSAVLTLQLIGPWLLITQEAKTAYKRCRYTHIIRRLSNFLFETVVRKQLASYPLKQFIKDVLERLVKKTLQPSECFEKGREKRAINISLNNVAITKSVADLIGVSDVYSGQATGRFM